MAKIKIEKDLYQKVRQVSQNAGYASVEEFVSHLLEKIVEAPDQWEKDEDVVKRLQGLGYIS
ncbi:MAG: hypothetical protein ACE5DO_02250 [Desulfobacterales bacterium]